MCLHRRAQSKLICVPNEEDLTIVDMLQHDRDYGLTARSNLVNLVKVEGEYEVFFDGSAHSRQDRAWALSYCESGQRECPRGLRPPTLKSRRLADGCNRSKRTARAGPAYWCRESPLWATHRRYRTC